MDLLALRDADILGLAETGQQSGSEALLLGRHIVELWVGRDPNGFRFKGLQAG